MQNYLNQLAQRIQQPELGVQPRPVSRFESAQYSNFESSADSSEPASESTFEPFASITVGESGETELPSGQFISTRIGADKLAQRIESRNRNESKTVDSTLETTSTTEPQQPYLGQPISEPSIATHADKKLAAHRSMLEGGPIAVGKQSIAQSGRNAQPAKEPIKPVSQIEKPDELEIPSLDKPSSERSKLTGPIGHVVHTERTQIKPGSADIKKPADASNAALTGSVARQHYSDKKESPAQIGTEQIRSFVPLVNNDENLEKKKAPSNSVHISTTGTAILANTESFETRPLPERRSDLMPRADFSSTQRRKIFKPFAENTEHAMERSDEAPTPTIQVTIGRIEVRATVAAATPARKTPAKSPAMSLDEYLKQRNGGQR